MTNLVPIYKNDIVDDDSGVNQYMLTRLTRRINLAGAWDKVGPDFYSMASTFTGFKLEVATNAETVSAFLHELAEIHTVVAETVCFHNTDRPISEEPNEDDLSFALDLLVRNCEPSNITTKTFWFDRVCKAVPFNSVRYKIVALLKDVLQKSCVTEKYLRTVFNTEIVDAIVALTKKDSVRFDEFMVGVTENSIASFVLEMQMSGVNKC